MQSRYLISVVLPVYNAERFLRQCLDSIINQTLRNIEIICVDDGSTDGSLAILREYAARDARVIIVTQENKGAGAARNKGIEVARGEYLSFLDSDDFFELSMLEKARAKAVKDNADIVVWQCDRYNNETEAFMPYRWSVRYELLPGTDVFKASDIKENIFRAFVWWAWDKLFRRELVMQEGIRFQEIRTTNDLFFCSALFIKAKRVCVLPEVLAHQRVNLPQSLSSTREQSWQCYYFALTALQKKLLEWNLYDRYARDFVNYALHFSLWQLRSLDCDAKNALLGMLRRKWFRDLGVEGRDAKYFYSENDFIQYVSLRRKKKFNKARSLVQCLCDNGPGYTLRRAIEHLGIPMNAEMPRKKKH